MESDKPATKQRATPERLAKAGEDVAEVAQYSEDKTGRGETTHGVQRLVDNPLDRLLKQGVIRKREYQAGNKLRADYYLAGTFASPAAPRYTAGDRSEPHGRLPRALASIAARVVDARAGVDRVRKHFHPELLTILDLALVHEKSLEEIGRGMFGYASQREAANTGKVAFRVVLMALADFYEATLSG